MKDEFSIPTWGEKDELNAEDITDESLQTIKCLEDEPLTIHNPLVFNTLVGFAKTFETLEGGTKTKAWRTLLSGLEQFSHYVASNFADVEAGSVQCTESRNAAKKFVFIVSWIAVTEEGEAVKVTKHIAKSKKATKKSMVWDWNDERSSCVSTLRSLLKSDISRLWPMSCPEEQFVTLITRTIYHFLENPVAIKNSDLKDDIFNVLALLVHKYNHTVGAATSITHLLPHFEHLVTPMAQLIKFCCEKSEDGSRVLSEVVREMGRMDPSELNRDASGARNYGLFISELGEQIPDVLLQHISLLLPHLEGESYPMRNGVLCALGSMIRAILTKDTTEMALNTRDQFLMILKAHFHDVNAYVRAKTIQIWKQLAVEKAIPLASFKELVNLTTMRLTDKSSVVRKQALQLLVVLMNCNPFGAKLSLSVLKASYEVEEKKYNDAYPDDATSKANKEEANETNSSSPVTPKKAVPKLADSDSEDEFEGDMNADIAEPEVPEMSDAQTQQKALVQYLADSVLFAEQLQDAVITVSQLLGSKSTTDITESIDFFVTANEFEIDNAIVGVNKLFALVWSKDAAIQGAVVQAFKRLYLSPDPAVYTTSKEKSVHMAKNLVEIAVGADLGFLTSMQELVQTAMKDKLIPSAVVSRLWDMFKNPAEETGDQSTTTTSAVARCRGALVVLGMAAQSQQSIVTQNLATLVALGFGDRGHRDMLFVRDTCLALKCLVPKPKKGSAPEAPVRFAPNHVVFQKLTEVTTNEENLLVEGWYPAMEEAINTIYSLGDHPDHLAHAIIGKLSQIASKTTDETYSSQLVARLLFTVGHVALKQLVFLESIEVEMKRRRNIEVENATTINSTTEEDDMGIGGPPADDVETEFIAAISENEIVTGNGLLARYTNLILAICTSPAKFCNIELQNAGALALCKFMCVSAAFCEQHLQLLFTILKKSSSAMIRANMIVSLGDLAFRFPNLIEPWTAELYQRLRDESSLVRKHTLMVLTHLILNDMVKVKGQISQIVLCLHDPEEHIGNLSRMFFYELSQKGNAIYNILPDIISHLADPSAGLSPDQFRNIMSYLFLFIKKDRQADSLVEKLCHRFRTTHDVAQWRLFAFCLTLITYSERCVKRLTDQIQCFHDKLTDAEVYKSFQDVISKAKKFAKPETKEAVCEFEAKLAALHSGDIDENQDPMAPLTAKKKTKKSARKTRRSQQDSDEDESDESDESDDGANRAPLRQVNNAKNTKTPRTTATKKRVTSRTATKTTKGGRRRGRQTQDTSSDESDMDTLLMSEDDDVCV